MELVWDELSAGWPTADHLVRVSVRLIVAALLAAVIGYQRERIGKAAGLRTHILVSVGCAFFVIASVESDFGPDALSRVIQGITTGIGFIGGGAILKLSHEHEIKGLTTAAGIWATAAIGVAAGLGRIGAAVIAMVLAWITLAVIQRLEAIIGADTDHA